MSISQNPEQMESVRGSVMTERGLQSYRDYLDVVDSDLGKGKVIVEIGSGTEQDFAKEVKLKGHEAKVISIDPRLGLSEAVDLGSQINTIKMQIKRRRNYLPMGIKCMS